MADDINVNALAEIVNQKLDIDMANANPTASAKQQIVSWSMPSWGG